MIESGPGWPENHSCCGSSYYRHQDNTGYIGTKLSLDSYGFPQMAIANRVLLKQHDYGGSREDLEDGWERWISHAPFDIPVAKALSDIYSHRIERLDNKKDSSVYYRLEHKLQLLNDRIERYSTDCL